MYKLKKIFVNIFFKSYIYFWKHYICSMERQHHWVIWFVKWWSNYHENPMFIWRQWGGVWNKEAVIYIYIVVSVIHNSFSGEFWSLGKIKDHIEYTVPQRVMMGIFLLSYFIRKIVLQGNTQVLWGNVLQHILNCMTKTTPQMTHYGGPYNRS